jgi:uncharacterized protein YbjT (DUF2867 family)
LNAHESIMCDEATIRTEPVIYDTAGRGHDSSVIVVTTPTGQIGHQVLENVLLGTEPVRVVARNEGALPAEVRARVDVVVGSHSDAEVVDRAFRGADSVFWLCPPDPHASSAEAAYVDFTRPAADAITRHNVARVVGISALGRGTRAAAHAGLVTASLAMDDLLASTTASYCAVLNPSFMDNLLRQVEAIRTQGAFFLPVDGDLKQPSCATRDIAAAASRLLLDHSWAGNRTQPVMGPEDLSFNDMAAIMSDVLGRAIRFRRIPDDQFTSRLLGFGMSEPMAQATLDMWVAYGEGLDLGEPRTPGSTSPTSFREWCEDTLEPAVEAADRQASR